MFNLHQLLWLGGLGLICSHLLHLHLYLLALVVHSKVNNSNLLLSLPHSNNPHLSLVTINPLLHLRLAMMVLVLVLVLLYRRNYPRLYPDLFSHSPLHLHLVLALVLLDHLNNPRWRPAVARTHIYPLLLLIHLVEVLVMTTMTTVTTMTTAAAGHLMSALTQTLC